MTPCLSLAVTGFPEVVGSNTTLVRDFFSFSVWAHFLSRDNLIAASELRSLAATLIVTVSLWSMHTISHLDLRPGWLAGYG